MNVSIIVINYNTKNTTINCINSIFEKTKNISFEVILVDNASMDGSKEYFEKESRIKYIYLQDNIGFGKANNVGFSNSKGECVLLLNSDTLMLNNAVKIFYDYFIGTSDKIGCIGAILKNKEGRNIHSYGEFITIKRELMDVVSKYLRFLKNSERINPKDVETVKGVEYVTGADLFIPRNVYSEIGGFDPAFFMYCEEVDMQYRMYKSGYKCQIINGPKILHLEGLSYDQHSNRIWSVKRAKELNESKMIYLRKYNNLVKCKLFCMLYGVLQFPLFIIVKVLDFSRVYLSKG